MFCPRCGKTDEELYDGLCKSCFIKEAVLIDVPDEIEVTVCVHCGSKLSEGKWEDMNLSEDETIFNAISDCITINDNAKDVEISVEAITERGTIIEHIIHGKGNILGEVVEQDFKTTVRIKKTVCPECSKFQSGYYEAVIQLRADGRVPEEEEIQTVDEIIIKTIDKISQKNKMAYISDRLHLKEGIDYYVGSYKVAKRLENTIREIIGGIVKESPRLMGRDKSTGKDLYRIWISLRIPYFREGDFIKYDSVIGKVTSIDGKKVSYYDVRSFNKSSILWRNYSKIDTVAKKEDVKKTTVTAKTPISIQILHPDTYQPVDLEIHEGINGINIGEEVPVIEIGGIIYILMV